MRSPAATKITDATAPPDILLDPLLLADALQHALKYLLILETPSEQCLRVSDLKHPLTFSRVSVELQDGACSMHFALRVNAEWEKGKHVDKTLSVNLVVVNPARLS